ncbi:hypothetical protein [Spiroplasma endosymbiont of Cantharis nigra]|uniref:hypothetical protein n=1 Tax=Spiroplasma endosymbiont of Cantharis nigra TaxID=3066278 RepID=UPI0030D3129D
MEKIVVDKNLKKKNFKNFTLLYSINLKLSMKNVGSIISGIIFTLATIIFFIVEYTKIIKTSDIASYSSLKYFTFLVGATSLIFHILLNSLYLFKRQVKDGISSIELRAGYKTWKSYLIRILITFTVACIYITIPLLFAIFLNLISLNNSTLFFNLHYSQTFFFYFLALFSTIFISLIMVIFKTSLATLFSMIFMITVGLAPMFASLKFIMSTTKVDNWKTNIKMLSAQDFYNTFKKDKELFNDDDGNGNSLSLHGMNSYLINILDPLKQYEETVEIEDKANKKFSYKIVPTEDFFPGWNSKRYLSKNEFSDNGNFNYEKATHILLKNIGFGQVYYNYNIFGANNEVDQQYLLERTPIWKIIEKINKTTLENKDVLISENENEVPSLFVKGESQYYNANRVESKDINIDNFVNQISEKLPEYSNILVFIKNFYNKYKTSIIADNNDSYFSNDKIYNEIFDLTLVNSKGLSYDKNFDFFSWKKVYEYGQENFNDNFADDFCNLTLRDEDGKTNLEVCQNNKIIEQNNEMAKVYKKFPELTIINALIINLWKESMEFDVVRPISRDNKAVTIDDGLYSYFNISKKSNTLTTDISRHFTAMSTGLFSSNLLNDSYNSTGTVFFQGQFLSIKNIFDFENSSSENQSRGSSMKPVYEKNKIKKRTSFIIPLAYFCYIVIIMPFGYVGYLIFDKKAKL